MCFWNNLYVVRSRSKNWKINISSSKKAKGSKKNIQIRTFPEGNEHYYHRVCYQNNTMGALSEAGIASAYTSGTPVFTLGL